MRKTLRVHAALKDCGLPVLFCYSHPRWVTPETVRYWAKKAEETLGEVCPETVSRPFDFFAWLMTVTKDRPAVCVIDDCRGLASEGEPFWKAFRRLWRKERDTSRLCLVFVGTQSPETEVLFTGPAAETAGCLTVRIEASAMTPSEVKAALAAAVPDMKPLDELMIWAVTGGVQSYVERLIRNNALTTEAPPTDSWWYF